MSGAIPQFNDTRFTNRICNQSVLLEKQAKSISRMIRKLDKSGIEVTKTSVRLNFSDVAPDYLLLGNSLDGTRNKYNRKNNSVHFVDSNNSSDTESDSVRTARSGSSQSMKELSILRLQRTTLYKERAREQLEALQRLQWEHDATTQHSNTVAATHHLQERMKHNFLACLFARSRRHRRLLAASVQHAFSWLLAHFRHWRRTTYKNKFLKDRVSNGAIKNKKVVPFRVHRRAAVVAAFSWWHRITAHSRQGTRFRLRHAWKYLKQVLVASINRRRFFEQRRKHSFPSWAFVRWRAKSVLQQRQRTFNAGIIHVQRTLTRCLMRWRTRRLGWTREKLALNAMVGSRQSRFFFILKHRLNNRRARLERLLRYTQEHLSWNGNRHRCLHAADKVHRRRIDTAHGTSRKERASRLNIQLLRFWQRWTRRFRRSQENQGQIQLHIVAGKNDWTLGRGQRMTPSLQRHIKLLKRIYLSRMIQHTLQAYRCSYNLRAAAARARAQLLRTLLPRAFHLLRKMAGDRRNRLLASAHFSRRVVNIAFNKLLSRHQQRAVNRLKIRSGDCMWALRSLRKGLHRWVTWMQPRLQAGRRDRLGRALHSHRAKSTALARWCDHCLQSCHFLKHLISAKHCRSHRLSSGYFRRWRCIAQAKKEEEGFGKVSARNRIVKSVKKILETRTKPLVRGELLHRRKVVVDSLSRWIAHTHYRSANHSYMKSVMLKHQVRSLFMSWRKLKDSLLDKKGKVGSGWRLRIFVLLRCAMKKLITRKSRRGLLRKRVCDFLRKVYLRRWVRYFRGRRRQMKRSTTPSHILRICLGRAVRQWQGITGLRKCHGVSSSLADRYRLLLVGQPALYHWRRTIQSLVEEKTRSKLQRRRSLFQKFLHRWTMRKLDTEAEGCRRDAAKAAEKHFRVRLCRVAMQRVLQPLLRRAMRRLQRADAFSKQVRVCGSLRTLANLIISRRGSCARVMSAERFAASRMVSKAFQNLCRIRMLKSQAERWMLVAEDCYIVRRLGSTLQAFSAFRSARNTAATAAATTCWKKICFRKLLQMVKRRAEWKNMTHTRLNLRPSRALHSPRTFASVPVKRRDFKSPSVIVPLGKVITTLTLQRAVRTWKALFHSSQVRATATVHWRSKAMRKSLICWWDGVRNHLVRRKLHRVNLTRTALRAWNSHTQQLIGRSTKSSSLLSAYSLRKRKERLRIAILRLKMVALTLSAFRARRAMLAANWTRWMRKFRVSILWRPNRRRDNQKQVRFVLLSRYWAHLQQWLSSRRKRRRISAVMWRGAPTPSPLRLLTEKVFHRWRTYCHRRATYRQQARLVTFDLRRRSLLLRAMRVLCLRCLHHGPSLRRHHLYGFPRKARLQQLQKQRRTQLRLSLRALCGFAAGRWAQRQEVRLLLQEQQRRRLLFGLAALRALVMVQRSDINPCPSFSVARVF